VKADQSFDLAAEARRGIPAPEIARIVARRFVEMALQGMPSRRVEARAAGAR
jgi:hypothetical protein